MPIEELGRVGVREQFDANSNLLTVTDAKGQQTVYTPNNMNRTTNRQDPLLQNEGYTYDNNGNLKTVTDCKGQITTYTYDPLNRRTKTLFHDNTRRSSNGVASCIDT